MAEESEEQGSANAFKIMAAFGLFTVAVAGGLLPMRLRHVDLRVLSSLNTAAGGVFFASAMVHMLPESSETLRGAWNGVVPWGELICSLGFLLILCVDQAVSIASANRKKNSGMGHLLIPMEDTQDDGLSTGLPRAVIPGGSDLMTDIYSRALLDSPTMVERSSSLTPRQHPLSPIPRGNGGGGSNGEAHAESKDVHAASRGRPGSDAENGGGGINGNGHRMRASDSGGHVYHHLHEQHHHVGHSHGVGVAGDGFLVRLALLLALSVHSIMEGLGVGAGSSKAWNLFFAIGAHKGLAAYALGTSLLQTGVMGNELTGYVLAFSAMTPVGILLGALIEEDGEDDVAGAVCVALAAGSFLYVALMEVLPPELNSTEHGWSKLGCLLVGFALSAGIGLLVG